MTQTSATPVFDLGLGLEGTHVLVTGGTGAIGSVTVNAFLQAGAVVSVFDVKNVPSPRAAVLPADRYKEYQVDISDPVQLQKAFEEANQQFGLVQVCVALASKDLSYVKHHASILDMPIDQWKSTFEVNVHGTFLTTQLWMRQLKQFVNNSNNSNSLKNLSLVIIGSESGHFGELGNPDYAAGKSAVMYGLVQSLRKDLVLIHPSARVNVVAPGPVDTHQFRKECNANPDQYYQDCQATTAMKRPVSVDGVARSIVFLASENWSRDVMAQTLNVDSGKYGKLLWTK